MAKDLQRIPANAVDQRLLMGAANMSPAELSASIGGIMNPAQVASHVKKLLADRDWLTETELDNLTTYKLQRALGKLESRFEDYDNLGLQLKFLKEIGTRLDKRRDATQFDLNALYGNQGRLMASLLDEIVNRLHASVQDTIDVESWDVIADEALSLARAEIEKREVAD